MGHTVRSSGTLSRTVFCFGAVATTWIVPLYCPGMASWAMVSSIQIGWDVSGGTSNPSTIVSRGSGLQPPPLPSYRGLCLVSTKPTCLMSTVMPAVAGSPVTTTPTPVSPPTVSMSELCRSRSWIVSTSPRAPATSLAAPSHDEPWPKSAQVECGRIGRVAATTQSSGPEPGHPTCATPSGRSWAAAATTRKHLACDTMVVPGGRGSWGTSINLIRTVTSTQSHNIATSVSFVIDAILICTTVRYYGTTPGFRAIATSLPITTR